MYFTRNFNIKLQLPYCFYRISLFVIVFVAVCNASSQIFTSRHIGDIECQVAVHLSLHQPRGVIFCVLSRRQSKLGSIVGDTFENHPFAAPSKKINTEGLIRAYSLTLRVYLLVFCFQLISFSLLLLLYYIKYTGRASARLRVLCGAACAHTHTLSHFGQPQGIKHQALRRHIDRCLKIQQRRHPITIFTNMHL